MYDDVSNHDPKYEGVKIQKSHNDSELISLQSTVLHVSCTKIFFYIHFITILLEHTR